MDLRFVNKSKGSLCDLRLSTKDTEIYPNQNPANRTAWWIKNRFELPTNSEVIREKLKEYDEIYLILITTYGEFRQKINKELF